MSDRVVSNEQLLRQLHWRYATKQFDPGRKLSESDWNTLQQSLILSASSFGLQPWKFVVVTDQAVKERLVAHSWNQRQVADCSHLVVLAARRSIDEAYVNKFIARMASARGTEPAKLEGYRQMILGSVKSTEGNHLPWNSRQVYIALGTLLTGAALLGIDACPMEGIVPAEYDRELSLAGTDYTAIVACPLGYRSPADKYATAPKVRFDAADLIKHV